MRYRRLSSALIILGLLLGGMLAAPPHAHAAEECFTATNQCIRGRFLDYWETNGGLARNGFPLSEERREVLEDGREYTVQFFERVRLEYHPENAAPYDVLLGQFGRRVLRTQDPFGTFGTNPTEPRPGMVYFPETGHNLGGRFLAYWQRNGDLAQFGFPLTDEIPQMLEGGATYQVQYFERARLEFHPENQPPYDVLLGQFGRRILSDNDFLGVATGSGLGVLYITNEEVQGRLGLPTASAATAPGATQAFERGRMIWRGDTSRIYVLCGGEQAGPAVYDFPDTWDAGQDPGGGPAPPPGLFLPQRGFGKLWRDTPAVRDCLGYALTAEETGYTLQAQPFKSRYGDNLMVSVTTPEGHFIYVVYHNYLGGSSCISRPDVCAPDYDRYADPSR